MGLVIDYAIHFTIWFRDLVIHIKLMNKRLGNSYKWYKSCCGFLRFAPDTITALCGCSRNLW